MEWDQIAGRGKRWHYECAHCEHTPQPHREHPPHPPPEHPSLAPRAATAACTSTNGKRSGRKGRRNAPGAAAGISRTSHRSPASRTGPGVAGSSGLQKEGNKLADAQVPPLTKSAFVSAAVLRGAGRGSGTSAVCSGLICALHRGRAGASPRQLRAWGRSWIV